MKQSIKNKISGILLIIYSVFLILTGIGSFTTSIIGGLIIIICGLIERPAIRGILIKKINILNNKIIFMISIIFFLLTIIVISNKDNLPKTNNIISNTNNIEQLDKSTYEIINTKHNQIVQNFYVFIKYNNFTIENIKDFIGKFRKEFCEQDCNINLYDSKTILSLVDKYPIKGEEYINIANHFIAESSFDAPEDIWWYPLQDIQYKEFGGKDRKKEPIK